MSAEAPSADRPCGPEMDHEEVLRVYGPWAPLSPREVAELLDGFDRPWWVVGGWSIEAFTGVPREHEDTDISILSSDALALARHLGEAWTPWNVTNGWLRPFGERFPQIEPDAQLWLRRDGASPWVLDIPLTPSDDGRWHSKRNRAHAEDLDDVTWVADDGLRYARPEVSLLFKARQDRPKDREDARVTIPLLDDPARRRLRDAVAAWDPTHPWAREEWFPA